MDNSLSQLNYILFQNKLKHDTVHVQNLNISKPHQQFSDWGLSYTIGQKYVGIRINL
mgnify:CR=1 FL=1